MKLELLEKDNEFSEQFKDTAKALFEDIVQTEIDAQKEQMQEQFTEFKNNVLPLDYDTLKEMEESTSQMQEKIKEKGNSDINADIAKRRKERKAKQAKNKKDGYKDPKAIAKEKDEAKPTIDESHKDIFKDYVVDVPDLFGKPAKEKSYKFRM